MTDTKALHLSKSAEWRTPPRIIEAAKMVLGEIDLDPASTEAANVWIGAKKIYTKKDDGLEHDWEGRVWLNPPGDKSGKLVKLFWSKLVESFEGGGVTEAIWLGFSLEQLVTLQLPYVTLTPLYYPVCVPKTRIQFINKRGEICKQPTHGNYLCYLGKRRRLFYDVFYEQVGAVR